MSYILVNAVVEPEIGNPVVYYSIVIVISILIGAMMIFFSVIKKAKKARKEELDARFQNKKILFYSKNANFLGYKSKNYKQVTGSGYLVLTEEELYFLMWLPPHEIKIEITKITKIEFPELFLGKNSKKIVKINYINNEKQSDEIAWSIPKLDKIKSELKKLNLL